MIAYCGLLCDTCPIHLATLEENETRKVSMRESVVRICHDKYGMNLTIQNITDCDGCRADTGKIFSGCKNCDIRICSSGKDIELCSYCKDYPCNKLDRVFHEDPGARARLDKIKESFPA